LYWKLCELQNATGYYVIVIIGEERSGRKRETEGDRGCTDPKIKRHTISANEQMENSKKKKKEKRKQKNGKEGKKEINEKR